MTNEAVKAEIHNRIQHLREGYLARTADDIQSLIVMLEPCQGELPALLRDELRMRLHRVAGSAGSFGFTEMGARARLLELRMVPDADSIDLPSLRGSLDKLRKLVDSLREPESMQEPPVEPQSIDSSVPLIEGTTGLRLLIGGDDPNYCQLLAALLDNSFSIALAHSGAEVLEEYTNSDADIILLDVGLPDMSGYQVCQQMEQIRERQWRSVVFVSVNNGVDDKVAAYDAGGDDFIAKPIQLDEFVAKLKTLASYTQSKKNLLSQSQFAQKLAFDSMAEIAQYGRLVDFMRSAMGCRDHDSLAVVFFDTMDALGLKASLRLGSTPWCAFPDPINPAARLKATYWKPSPAKTDCSTWVCGPWLTGDTQAFWSRTCQ